VVALLDQGDGKGVARAHPGRSCWGKNPVYRGWVDAACRALNAGQRRELRSAWLHAIAWAGRCPASCIWASSPWLMRCWAKAGRGGPAGDAVNPSMEAWSPHPCGSHPRKPAPTHLLTVCRCHGKRGRRPLAVMLSSFGRHSAFPLATRRPSSDRASACGCSPKCMKPGKARLQVNVCNRGSRATPGFMRIRRSGRPQATAW